MIVAPFINLFRTTQEAFFFKNSQLNTQFIFKGVQLLPNNPTKYIQVTQTPNGINLEEWTAFIVEQNGTKTDVTDYFFVDSLTNDLDGAPQLYWSLTDVPFDFGYNLVTLEVTQTLGETFYSNPFLLTEIESEKTSIFHYKQKKEGVFQCIGLQAWYLDTTKETELTTYYEISTRNTVSQSIQTSDIDIYRTELMPKNQILNLTYLLESPVLFINTKRASLYKAVEIPEKTAQENFVSVDFQVSPNNNQSFFSLTDYNGIDYGTDYNI